MSEIQIPISDFHAHIYFSPDSRASAEKFRQLISKHLASQLRYVGNLIDRPVGPHPVPMFELNFLPENFAQVVTFLMQNHGSHSVLIHPQTGNDPIDHSTHALWLGAQLKLDFSKLH